MRPTGITPESGSRGEDESSTGESGKANEPRKGAGASPGETVYRDDLMEITKVDDAGATVIPERNNPSQSSSSPPDISETKRAYTSDAIDRGEVPGMMFHPVTGEFLGNLTFNPSTHCFESTHNHGETLGWGESDRSEKDRPRIGDGYDHAEGDFSLRHWIFDHRTGNRLPPKDDTDADPC